MSSRRPPIDVPEAVRGKALALGQLGRQWLHDLPELVAALASEWNLTIDATLSGGSAAYVAAVTTGDGIPAILKLQLRGYDDIATEIRVLHIADGRGYARLLQADEARGAVLLERLGPRLSELGFSVTRQIEIICATLRQAWIESPEAVTFPSGAEKARWLRTFITDTWDSLNRPCSERVIELAVDFCDAREVAFDPERSILVHGDAHSGNTLAPYGVQPGSSADALPVTSFKLVDPDGLFAERAYDLAILLRGWNAELLAGDVLRRGQERCALLSQISGQDSEAIWQWGFIERVSTGLLLMQMGRVHEGREYLRVAEIFTNG